MLFKLLYSAPHTSKFTVRHRRWHLPITWRTTALAHYRASLQTLWNSPPSSEQALPAQHSPAQAGTGSEDHKPTGEAPPAEEVNILILCRLVTGVTMKRNCKAPQLDGLETTSLKEKPLVLISVLFYLLLVLPPATRRTL